MSDRDATDPSVPRRAGGVVSGESTPPDEHTRRVEAAKKKTAPTVVKVHDSREAPKAAAPKAEEAAPAPPVPEARSSTELAERSRRDRRRARDRRAERLALLSIFGLFGAIGVGGYYLLSSELLNGPEVEPGEPTTPVQRPPEPPRVVSSARDETPDLPALRSMLSEGLTIAAEGIPEVTPSEATPQASVAAAIETCRLAYGVWEFSPNRRFRFLPTCAAFEGTVLVGAYELKGSVVQLSPLIDGPVQIVSTFEVEKPSRMISEITVSSGDRVLSMRAAQRVTTLRGGMQGEGFHDTFAPKNTLQVPGGRPRVPAAPSGGDKPHDPLLDLIRQKKTE